MPIQECAIKQTEAAVHAEIEALRPYYVHLLQRLVQTPSPLGLERDAQMMLAGEMKRLNLEVDVFDIAPIKLRQHPGFNTDHRKSFVDRPLVVGTWKGIGGGRSLILNAHVDTVPEGDISAWTDSPTSGRVVGDKVMGRGAWDDKAACVQLLWITEALQRCNVRLKGDLVLQSVIEDETTANGTLACIQRGHSADGAIILDGTSSDAIIVSHMGQQVFRVTIYGRPAPSCVSFRGHNPIETASRLVLKLGELQERKNDERGAPWGAAERPIFITVGYIHSGDGPYAVPNRAVIEGHLGFCPPQTLAEAREELRQALAEVCEGDPWLKENPCTLEFCGYTCEPYSVDPDNELIKTLCGNVKRLRDRDLRKLHITGAGDLRHLICPETGKPIPCCMHGPGRGRGAHVPDEYVEIPDVIEVAQNVASTALEWCGFENSES